MITLLGRNCLFILACSSLVVSSSVYAQAENDEAKLDRLIRELGHSNTENRKRAMELLGEMGDAAAPAVPKLVAASEGGLGLEAGAALGRIGECAVPRLVAEIGHRDDDIRIAVSSGLYRIASKREDAFEALVTGLSDKNHYVRLFSILGARASRPMQIPVPALVELLSDKRDNVYRMAAEILTKIGPKAEAAIPFLQHDLDFDDGYVVPAFAAMGTAAVPILCEELDKPRSLRAQCRAASACGLIGAKAESAIPTLLRIVGTTDNSALAHECITVLGEIGVLNETVRDVLSSISTQSPDGKLRTCARDTLELLGRKQATVRVTVQPPSPPPAPKQP